MPDCNIECVVKWIGEQKNADTLRMVKKASETRLAALKHENDTLGVNVGTSDVYKPVKDANGKDVC